MRGAISCLPWLRDNVLSPNRFRSGGWKHFGQCWTPSGAVLAFPQFWHRPQSREWRLRQRHTHRHDQKHSKNIPVVRYLQGAGARPRLKSWGEPRFGSQRRGSCAPRPAKAGLGVGCVRGSPPLAVRFRGYYPRKIFENSDAKSCILVTTCCEISCFFENYGKKVGGSIHCWSPT